MKKVKELVKDNWLFLLFVIPFILICMNNKVPTNDMWFLLNLGKYVHNSGIPTIDPFTIHEGMNYVMHQWGSASIFWEFFNTFGKNGLLVLLYIVSFSLMFVFYYICKNVSKKKNISIIFTAIAFSFIFEYVVHRPQIFTYLILLLEILFMELYVEKKNWKYLIPLPILSILLINMHSSMWYFQFVFMLPFIVNSIDLKKITIDKYKLKPLIIVMIIMFMCGFINPYGIDAITFVFKSYGLDLINENINEMIAPSFSNMHAGYMKIVIVLLCGMVLALKYLKKIKLDLRHICFLLGTMILFFMHAKCYPFFIFAYFYSLSYGIKGTKAIKFRDKRIINLLAIGKSFSYAFCLMLFFSFFYLIYNMSQFYFFHPSVLFDKDSEIIADYLVENYDESKIRLYINYDNGGYYQYRGIKTYIDPRAELFFKSNNGKDDIFKEAVAIFNDVNFDYGEFLKKYEFTHLIVEASSLFNDYLNNCDNYELVFSSYYNENGKRLIYQNVYTLKN